MQAINDFGRPSYAGLCPPTGDKPNAYHFRLSALSSAVIPAAPSATCGEIILLARPDVIEYVELVGFYGRTK